MEFIQINPALIACFLQLLVSSLLSGCQGGWEFMEVRFAGVLLFTVAV